MIGRLRGEIVAKNPPWLLLDVSGVGYELEAPMSTFYALPEVGQAVTLVTHLHVREDAHALYGFFSEAERSLFRSLIRISGVGAKMALAILSGMEAEAFRGCVYDGDIDALIRLPGVGRKTAERLVVEMRGRLDTSLPASVSRCSGLSTAPSGPPKPVEDAVRALIALGYKPPEANRMVNRVDASGKSSEDIIRLALKASLT